MHPKGAEDFLHSHLNNNLTFTHSHRRSPCISFSHTHTRTKNRKRKWILDEFSDRGGSARGGSAFSFSSIAIKLTLHCSFHQRQQLPSQSGLITAYQRVTKTWRSSADPAWGFVSPATDNKLVQRGRRCSHNAWSSADHLAVITITQHSHEVIDRLERRALGGWGNVHQLDGGIVMAREIFSDR